MGFINAFNRIRLETGIQTQEQLARFLGIKQASVSGAKKRGQFPRAWAEKIGKQFNLRYEWIMEGAEPKRLVPNMDPGEINAVFDRLWFILAKASDEDRIRVKNVIDEVFQKTKSAL